VAKRVPFSKRKGQGYSGGPVLELNEVPSSASLEHLNAYLLPFIEIEGESQ
jgi:hypothetical protein